MQGQITRSVVLFGERATVNDEGEKIVLPAIDNKDMLAVLVEEYAAYIPPLPSACRNWLRTRFDGLTGKRLTAVVDRLCAARKGSASDAAQGEIAKALNGGWFASHSYTRHGDKLHAILERPKVAKSAQDRRLASVKSLPASAVLGQLPIDIVKQYAATL